MDKNIEIKNGEAYVDFLKLVQTAEFEGRMAQLAEKAARPARRRLQRAGFKLSTGIWSGEKLAREYRTIMTSQSRQSSAVRQDITNIGDLTLKWFTDEAAARMKEEQEASKPAEAPEKPVKKTRAPRKTTTPKKKEAAS